MSNPVTPWTVARQTSQSITTSQSLLKLMSIELMMPSNHLILCHHLLLLPSVFSSIRVFSNEWALCITAKVLKLQSFQWIFRIDFLKDWLVCSSCSPKNSQESSLVLQFKSINSSVLSLLSGPVLTSVYNYWKNHIWTFVNKVMSLFNTLSRFFMTYLPRSKGLLISWLQSSSIVIWGPKKIKFVTVSNFPLLFAIKRWDWIPWYWFL